MELEELKSLWASLDNRLSKQEVIKDKMIKEMIMQKSGKSVRSLMWWDGIGLVVTLLFIPFMIFFLHLISNHPNTHWLSYTIVWMLIAALILYVPLYSARVYWLTRMDLSGNLLNNAAAVRRYALLLKWEKVFVYIFVPIAYLGLVCFYAIIHVSAWLWALLVCTMLLVVLFSWWIYGHYYKKHIAIISKSIEELKELEKE